jgi:hypothetical protein
MHHCRSIAPRGPSTTNWPASLASFSAQDDRVRDINSKRPRLTVTNEHSVCDYLPPTAASLPASAIAIAITQSSWLPDPPPDPPPARRMNVRHSVSSRVL